jgi:hypothetical protein
VLAGWEVGDADNEEGSDQEKVEEVDAESSVAGEGDEDGAVD